MARAGGESLTLYKNKQKGRNQSKSFPTTGRSGERGKLSNYEGAQTLATEREREELVLPPDYDKRLK